MVKPTDVRPLFVNLLEELKSRLMEVRRNEFENDRDRVIICNQDRKRELREDVPNVDALMAKYEAALDAEHAMALETALKACKVWIRTAEARGDVIDHETMVDRALWLAMFAPTIYPYVVLKREAAT